MIIEIISASELLKNEKLFKDVSDYNSYLYGYDDNRDKHFRSFLEKNKEDYYVVAIFKNKIIGKIRLEVEDNTIIISNVFVSEKYRNKGVANKMFEETINFIKNNLDGYELYSYVKQTNEVSLKLHMSNNFEVVGGRHGICELKCNLNKEKVLKK